MELWALVMYSHQSCDPIISHYYYCCCCYLFICLFLCHVFFLGMWLAQPLIKVGWHQMDKFCLKILPTNKVICYGWYSATQFWWDMVFHWWEFIYIYVHSHQLVPNEFFFFEFWTDGYVYDLYAVGDDSNSIDEVDLTIYPLWGCIFFTWNLFLL